ncbi:TipJ family phage tail tip protein, partial [Pseudomonas syringae group genomosp. 7]|uniref:TipJ family phage tail tip protein n=1 Tax=Pseudomonas syringae group genomosp. 7 TaxID=251699 RepID=UPI00376F5437
DPEAVHRFLDEHGIPAESRTRRLRVERERCLDVPVWVFSAEELTFDLAVPQLQKVNTDNGDTEGYAIDYAIDLSTDNGPFNTVLT